MTNTGGSIDFHVLTTTQPSTFSLTYPATIARINGVNAIVHFVSLATASKMAIRLTSTAIPIKTVPLNINRFKGTIKQ